jgi:hypothetical protein
MIRIDYTAMYPPSPWFVLYPIKRALAQTFCLRLTGIARFQM